MSRLQGKVAVITGAASGIGRAAAKMFAAEGARVAILDRAKQLGEEAAAEVTAAGGKAIACATDVTDEAAVQAAMAAAIEAFGQIDVLFNCAGGSSQRDRPVHEVDLALWKATMDLDLSGTFLCCRHAIPHMLEKQRGSVVNVGTWGALRGALPKHIYVSAKGAILSLTRAIAGEYTHAGIRANAICPGVVRTARSIASHENLSGPISKIEQRRAKLAEQYPFSIGQPEDIATIALFLASDESRMITGAVIPADGGRSAI